MIFFLSEIVFKDTKLWAENLPFGWAELNVKIWLDHPMMFADLRFVQASGLRSWPPLRSTSRSSETKPRPDTGQLNSVPVYAGTPSWI